jgi:hypothetical protein
MRRADTPHERLSVTLRFLTTARNYEDLKFSASISPQGVGVIIPETSRTVCQELTEEYCKV